VKVLVIQEPGDDTDDTEHARNLLKQWLNAFGRWKDVPVTRIEEPTTEPEPK